MNCSKCGCEMEDVDAFCPGCLNSVVIGPGGSTQKVPVEGSAFADILLQKIEAEILDTEGALISSRDAGHWTQHQILQGHKAGLLWVRNRINELLPNA